jgi:hypothetical protein
MSDKCDPEVFHHGAPLLLADTDECRATGFELWVQAVAKASGQPVDWHYSGGVAQVLVLGDMAKARTAARAIDCPARIMRWCEGEGGLYRQGVTETPPGAIGGFMGPGGEQVWLVKSE